MRIANKIRFSFFVTSLVLTSIAVPTLFLTSRAKLKESILNHLSTVIESRTNHIITYLDSNKEAIIQLSKSVIIRRLLMTDKSDKDYQQRYNDAMERLKKTSEAGKYVFGMCVVDPNGIIVASSASEEIGKDKSKNEFFLNAKKDVFIKDAYICTLGKQKSLGFSAPIKDEDNRLLGVVYMRFLMTTIDKITINRTGMGKTGEIYLTNKYGLVITPLRFKKNTFLKERANTVSVRKCLMHKTGQHAAGEKKVFVFSNYKGARVLGMHEYIPQTQWCLLTEIDEKEAFTPLTKIKIIFFILMIFIPIVGYLIGFFISRAITGPIHRLREGAEIIGEGNLDYKINVKSKDEIGQLSRAFNKMTEDLRKTTTSMDNLNKEIIVRKEAEDERDVVIRELEENQKKLKRQNQETADSRMAIKNVVNDLAKSKEELEEQGNSLKKINKELNDFTYIVSHDLKEPLRSISAFSKFINDDYRDCLDEEGKNYLERIRVNVNNLQNLIEDLLNISRIERMSISFEEIQTEKLVNEVKARLEYSIQQNNAEIFIKNKLPKVFCDRVRLTEVFLNLISNAVKFNDKPEPRIEIGSSKRGNFYEFYVKDNGPGIEKRYFDKIFEIFQRLCRKEEYEGTGAGLTIVKKVVQMYGGRIWVESKVGEGAVFYFTIPAAKEFIISRKKIGEILVGKKLVTEDDVKKALEEQS